MSAPETTANSSPSSLLATTPKDKLENKLHALVCTGQMTLHAAQVGIATNWQALYRTVFGGPRRTAVHAAIPAQWKNCTAVNRRYPHGVGRAGAHDRTAGEAPVTNFTRNTRTYNLAVHFNRGLDRDHDGVACESA